jgi:hypothetical protein
MGLTGRSIGGPDKDNGEEGISPLPQVDTGPKISPMRAANRADVVLRPCFSI